ncbi:MAG: FAD-binding protein [Ruminococcaceae bacterium]|nr:FAD-binding protein [Oscillospiraceae bacterium]
MHDIIIVGAGPAGLTAAIYALRADKSVLIFERGAFGGQMTYSPKIENFPGTVSASGTEIADKLVEQVINLGGEFEIGEVLSVNDNKDTKTVVADSGEYEAKAVIIANGVKHRLLGLEGEEELIGEGISFCAVCDGAFYRGKDVTVIGGGNSALQEAILLSDVAKSVTVVQNLAKLTGEGRLQKVISEKKNIKVITNTVVIEYLKNNGSLYGIKVKNTESGEASDIITDGVFVAIGLIPENAVFSELTELDDRGYFASGEDCTTKTAGIFVAGDCRAKRIRQVTTACADGAVAALAACEYLDK